MKTKKSKKGKPEAEPVPLTALEERQATLAHMVRMVARGMSNGLFAVGPGGLGKSRIIGQTLAEEGISPVMLNSHCTPLGLFTAMYNHRSEAVLWLDDADAMYTSLPVLGHRHGHRRRCGRLFARCADHWPRLRDPA